MQKEPAGDHIFLSYARADVELAAVVEQLLADEGQKVYIDYRDKGMPEDVSEETAERLRFAIRTCQLFMLLATNVAIKRPWVNWELGLADGLKTSARVIILPVADAWGRWEGNEYLRLYRRMEKVPDPDQPGKPSVLTRSNPPLAHQK